MLYRFFINYFRLKLLRIILNRIRGSKRINTKNLKIINILTYCLEFFTTYYLSGKRKIK
ncbi:Uncharacterised protein [Legionella cincinnatiensis]|uniref:Uncharacterized protein n=1 Tax=Legionella cincinnatiensis TaxID=28085 RepID=A0A378IKB4_9GAMM|nr:hypothetical protein Lcin_3391 [Legionella cincinnatiensis]STX35370.1 Uncharacterised protein [Legionella cincinnatiensis]